MIHRRTYRATSGYVILITKALQRVIHCENRPAMFTAHRQSDATRCAFQAKDEAGMELQLAFEGMQVRCFPDRASFHWY